MVRSAGILAVLLGAVVWSGSSEARADTRVGVSVGIGLPRGYSEVTVGRERYYTHRGTFYRRGPNGYVVVRAPRGAVVHVLPPHPTRIYVGSSVYYRYGDVYYQSVRGGGGYVVVDAPVVGPAEAPLPPVRPVEQEYQSVWVGQTEYLFKDGQFFTKTPEGLVWAAAPIGAMAKALPSDVQSIWYQGIEYYESDDIFFRKTPDGYQVVQAPWKKGNEIGADAPPPPTVVVPNAPPPVVVK